MAGEPKPFKTVAVIALSAAGRCLLLKQAGDEYWNFPSAPIADGETVEQAGWRGFYETTGFRLGALKPLTRRIKDGTDTSTLVAPIADEFAPRLADTISGWCWISPAKVATAAEPSPEVDVEQQIMSALDALDQRLAKAEQALA